MQGSNLENAADGLVQRRMADPLGYDDVTDSSSDPDDHLLTMVTMEDRLAALAGQQECRATQQEKATLRTARPAEQVRTWE